MGSADLGRVRINRRRHRSDRFWLGWWVRPVPRWPSCRRRREDGRPQGRPRGVEKVSQLPQQHGHNGAGRRHAAALHPRPAPSHHGSSWLLAPEWGHGRPVRISGPVRNDPGQSGTIDRRFELLTGEADSTRTARAYLASDGPLQLRPVAPAPPGPVGGGSTRPATPTTPGPSAQPCGWWSTGHRSPVSTPTRPGMTSATATASTC